MRSSCGEREQGARGGHYAKAEKPREKAGYALAGLFAAAIIYVIAFFVLDEASARFSVIAISAVIVLMTQPLAESEPFRTRGWPGWAIDAELVAAFFWSS